MKNDTVRIINYVGGEVKAVKDLMYDGKTLIQKNVVKKDKSAKETKEGVKKKAPSNNGKAF